MPSPELVRKALEAIQRPADFEFFFDELTSPVWIEPLSDQGIFDNPYPPIEEGEWVSFPVWPPSRYLVRMASQAPELVARVALKIPETKNVRVHEDIIEAALNMPASLSQKFVPKAIEWIKSPFSLGLPHKIGRFLSLLAREGYIEKALELVKGVLDVQPQKQESREAEGEKKYQLPPEPKAFIRESEYKSIIAEDIPVLTEKAGIPLLVLLCEILEKAITYSHHSEEEGPEDYSYIWRSAVEDHDQNLGLRLTDSLISGVRDTAEAIASSNPNLVKDIIQILENDPVTQNPRKWKVFKRLSLHMLRVHPDKVLDLINDRLTNHNFFDDSTLHHEYSLLLKNLFRRLDEPSRELILGWIDSGPDDLGLWVDFRESETGQKPSEAEIGRYKRYWQLKKLALLQESLPEPWKVRFEALTHELGQPEHPEFSSYSTGVMVGPTSPVDSADLASMTGTQLRDFLLNWRPSKEELGMEPSPEGLGRQLSELVASNPGKYSDYCYVFEGLDPTYVRSVLQGFRDALGKRAGFNWKPVIDLSHWVVNQPREIPGRVVNRWDADPDWGWARKTVASLLSAGFQQGNLTIPWNLRYEAWAALQPVTNDPHPQAEDEVREDNKPIDPTHISINSVRGEAMHAVIRYARWVRLNLKGRSTTEEKQGFDLMPEVRKVLDMHLDPHLDASLAIRSVYGQWLPTLHWLDSEWMVRNLKRIFPESKQMKSFYDAAWETYIIFSIPYTNMLKVLKAQYTKAIKNIKSVSPSGHHVGDPNEKLAEHLMAFYWHGALPLKPSNGILPAFYLKASDSLLGHANEFIGRSLKSTKVQIMPNILKRLRDLWEWRLEKTEIKPSAHVKELSAFGWWLASGKFSDRWSIRQLSSVLTHIGQIDADFLVMKQLVKLSKPMPLQTVHCVTMWCEGDKKGFEISSQTKEIKQIIESVLRRHSGPSRRAAIQLAEYLVSRGFREFDRLLTDYNSAKTNVSSPGR